MKKLLLCTIILSVHLAIAMKLPENNEPQKAWRNNFNNLDKKTYNKLVGYDLQLTLRPDDRKNVVHKIPSLLAHGWGSSPVGIIESARFIGPHRIPGDVFTFYFPDGNDFLNPFFIFNSSFGQEKDIKSLLIAIRAVYDCKLKCCNLFGQSRGAGTIVNALSILNLEINQWPTMLHNIQHWFPQSDRLKILDMIKNGVVVLDTPMITTQAGINTHVHKIFRGIFFEKFVCDLVNYCVLPLVTGGNYKPSGPQALKSADTIAEGFKILLSYQTKDSSVGNMHDEIFARKLKKELKNEVLVIFGYDGGKKICDATWNELQDAANNGIIKRWWGKTIPITRKHLAAHNAGLITLLESGLLNLFYQKHDGSYIDQGMGNNSELEKDLQPAHLKSWTHWKNNNASNDHGVIKNRLSFGNICMVIGGWGTLLLMGGVLFAYRKGYSLEEIYYFLKEMLTDLLSRRRC